MDEIKNYPPYLDYPKPYKPQTNADKIRAMSDEDFADILRVFCIEMADCIDCPLYRFGCPMSSNFNDWVKWLQQPVEGE